MQIGRRALRKTEEMRKRKRLAEQEDGDDVDDTDNVNDKCDELSKEIEGLGRILTGTYAMCAQDTVSPTLAHLIIMQDGERFVYSHGTTPLLISQLEDCLGGKTCSANYDQTKKKRKKNLVLV